MWKTAQEGSLRNPERSQTLEALVEGTVRKKNVVKVMNQKEDCRDPCCESAGEKQTKQSDRQRDAAGSNISGGLRIIIM